MRSWNSQKRMYQSVYTMHTYTLMEEYMCCKSVCCIYTYTEILVHSSKYPAMRPME